MKEYKKYIAINKKSGEEYIVVDAHLTLLTHGLVDLRVFDPNENKVYQVEQDDLCYWEIKEVSNE